MPQSLYSNETAWAYAPKYTVTRQLRPAYAVEDGFFFIVRLLKSILFSIIIIIIIVQSIYVDSRACVRVGNDVSEWFPVNVGLRQGCVKSPWLFNVYMDGV